MRTSEKSPRKWGLRTSPTYLRWRDDLGVDDYRLEINKKGRAR